MPLLDWPGPYVEVPMAKIRISQKKVADPEVIKCILTTRYQDENLSRNDFSQSGVLQMNFTEFQMCRAAIWLIKVSGETTETIKI